MQKVFNFKHYIASQIKALFKGFILKFVPEAVVFLYGLDVFKSFIVSARGNAEVAFRLSCEYSETLSPKQVPCWE